MSTGRKYTYDELIDMVKESSYTAPDVWSEMAGELDLSQELTQLPQYKAPDHIWDNIAAEIEVGPQKISNDSGNKTNWLMLVVGIVIGVLALALIQYCLTTDHKDKFEYKSEIEMASLYDNKVEVEENTSDVLEYIEHNSFLFDEEQLEEFNTELEEINEALKQLMELQEKYGLDESSHKLMARMERDRATLLKSMISDT